MYRLRPRLSYSNVMATVAVFIALGGSTYAATQLKKNSVGPKQLKKNSITTAKIKNQAVTAAKVRKGTLTGTQINASTLGTVPVANLAISIAPPEGWHLVGAAGEPVFQNGWKNSTPVPVGPETVAFYKDRVGVVHLRGAVMGGVAGKVIFQIPPGFQPAPGKILSFAAACACPGANTGIISVIGRNTGVPALDGAVAPSPATFITLDGITFRAES